MFFNPILEQKENKARGMASTRPRASGDPGAIRTLWTIAHSRFRGDERRARVSVFPVGACVAFRLYARRLPRVKITLARLAGAVAVCSSVVLFLMTTASEAGMQ